MSDLNLCQFIGRLGRDPEVRYMPNGDAVCNLSIGVGWGTKDKKGTEWVRASAFGKTAEICGQYLKKGKQIYISGAMSTRKWTDKDGAEKFSTEIRVDRMQMLGDAPGRTEREDNPDERQADKDRGGDTDDIPF